MSDYTLLFSSLDIYHKPEQFVVEPLETWGAVTDPKALAWKEEFVQRLYARKLVWKDSAKNCYSLPPNSRQREMNRSQNFWEFGKEQEGR